MSNTSVFPVGDTTYDATYAQEAAMIDASELIARALEASGMSRADLARRLGVSRGEITARLKGERNITVRKLAETLHALRETLIVSSEPQLQRNRAASQQWRFRGVPHPVARRREWNRPEATRVA